MLLELIVLILSVLVPSVIGWRLAGTRPTWSRLKVAVLAASPIVVIFVLLGLGFFAMSSLLTVSSCGAGTCDIFTAIVATMFSFAVLSGFVGAGAGAVGHLFSSRRRLAKSKSAFE